MEEVESRFLHLLQPIRDLTKNWEVDVATQLGEYLEEVSWGGPVPQRGAGEGQWGLPACSLQPPTRCRCSRLFPLPACVSVFLLFRVSQLDQICISFDNGKTTMNFIEAALLIQGSACIYSRKVRRPAATAASWPCSCRSARPAIPRPSSARAALGFERLGCNND